MSRFESYNDENPRHSMRDIKGLTQKTKAPAMPKSKLREKNSALVDLSHMYKNEVNEISVRAHKKNEETKAEADFSKSAQDMTEMTQKINGANVPTEVSREAQETRDSFDQSAITQHFEQLSDTDDSSPPDVSDSDNMLEIQNDGFDDSGLPEPEMFPPEMGILEYQERLYEAEMNYYSYMKPERFSEEEYEFSCEITPVDLEELHLSLGFITQPIFSDDD